MTLSHERIRIDQQTPCSAMISAVIILVLLTMLVATEADASDARLCMEKSERAPRP